MYYFLWLHFVIDNDFAWDKVAQNDWLKHLNANEKAFQDEWSKTPQWQWEIEQSISFVLTCYYASKGVCILSVEIPLFDMSRFQFYDK